MLEWEKIEGEELEDGFDDGVFVRGHGSGGTAAAGRTADLSAASIMTARTVGSNGGVSDNASTTKGTSGWTRLKNR